jgi:hypothetical protein
MRPIAVNVYTLLMFLAYVMRRAGTFSMEDKVNMIEFLSYMALNPNRVANPEHREPTILELRLGGERPIFLIIKVLGRDERSGS